MSNFITWISSVIVQQFWNIFHIFTGRCRQGPSAQVLVANCISPIVELSYPSGDRTIWKCKLYTNFLERFLNFYHAFTPPSLNLNICFLFVGHQRDCTVRHDSFVIDVIFTWRHVKLFFPVQILHKTLKVALQIFGRYMLLVCQASAWAHRPPWQFCKWRHIYMTSCKVIFSCANFARDIKGGYLDFSRLTKLKNIYITEIYMKKQYKSSMLRIIKLQTKFFWWCFPKRLHSLLSYF